MKLRPLLCLLIVLLLGACASPTRITNSWRDAAYHGPRFQRVLVMGFGDDGASRRVFEDRFVQQLQAAGVTAIASYTLVPGLAEADLPRVRDAVAKSGADCVLTTRLVGTERRIGVYPAQPMLMPSVGFRRGFYGYYSSVMVMPPSTYNYEVVTLESNLWQVPGESLLWSATTESFAPEDAAKGATELARVVIQALRGQGFL
ncbi:MAG: hypothetical protein HYU78_02470 [Rhodocyclales bacterium]|nr:hypothetical protein [Rhodocyclales bacterium]